MIKEMEMKKWAELKRCILFFVLVLLSQASILAQNWDIQIARHMNGCQSTFVRNTSVFLSESEIYFLLAAPISMATYGLIAKDKYVLQQAVATTVGLGITIGATYFLKYTVQRARPFKKYPTQITPYPELADGYSFPSSHTSTAFSLATSLTLSFNKWYVALPAYTWAMAVGLARINQGVHYPTDVLAGAVVGVGSAFLSHYLTQLVRKNGLSLFSKKDKVLAYQIY